jgi:aconitate hydratase
VTAPELVRPLAGGAERIVSLQAAQQHGVAGLSTAPRTVRILVENVLRRAIAREEDVDAALGLAGELIAACAAAGPAREIAIRPTRLILQDHTGVPVLSDFASLRSLVQEQGGDPRSVRPTLPVDLVIDHSVEVDAWGGHDAVARNMAREFRLNRERFRFLRWAQEAIDGLRIVPPGRGIVHQMNLEHLAQVAMRDADGWLAPDFVLGTDSHTPMIGGIGVLGWGVGGIEAETALLGHAISLRSPEVVGVRLDGALAPGVTATDLALTMTELLRAVGVVGRFVEFHGPGISTLSASDRATVANMAPEYGCTVAFFPVDTLTLDYLRLTGRSEDQVARVAAYTREQGLFDTGEPAELAFAKSVALDLSHVEPSVAGPRRPQDRLALGAVAGSFPPATVDRDAATATAAATAAGLRDGAIALAAITSCTNTSNAGAMVTAGLVARNAVARGLTPPPWVKTSLAPGSRAVVRYLQAAGLLAPLEALGFAVAGFGCTTCIGNSGRLTPDVEAAVRDAGLRPAAVLSGNRNFEGRIHRDVATAYLASPGLVVAYALAGTVLTDLGEDALGTGADGAPVRLADLWPAPDEIAAALAAVSAADFAAEKAELFAGGEDWAALDFPSGPVYDWPEDSTYLVRSPFFDAHRPPAGDLRGARVLVFAGDSTTTDHISPAGAITRASPGGRYLTEAGVAATELSSYGCRRGNHEVMLRGAFSNPKFRNRLTPETRGSATIHLPTGRPMAVHEAAAAYAAEDVPVVIVAGRDYGFGSSRDWAAKAPALLGVRAVLAQSFERIHRSNLIGTGIVPLQFLDDEGPDALGLTGHEHLDVLGFAAIAVRGEVEVRARDDAGDELARWRMLARVDTEGELEYLRNGGFLRTIAAPLLSAARTDGRSTAAAQAPGASAIASIETSSPRGSRTWAGAERAGGGSGMCRA